MGWVPSLFVSTTLAFAGATVQPPANDMPSEFRAYWVDAFGPGLYTEAEIEKLVADAKAANMNAIVAQIGRRGDCFCNRAAMPRTEANIAPYPFDPLRTLTDKAHANGLEVHAWITATGMWNSSTPPKDPRHVFNTHGPSARGDDDWTMVRYDRALRGGTDYYLDPGHPGAADYIVSMYTSVVANYDIDGVNLDRIRYPDYNLGQYVPSWGYNPVAVSRFQAATGRTDTPLPTDPEWMRWRRDQITSIVRRVYLETYALKPHVRVSADTITYGNGPLGQGGWERTRTYLEVLQDWRGWMEEGILDLNIPMNYKSEHLTTEPNNFRRMFEEWNEFIKDHQYARHAAIGSSLELNYIEGSVAQIRKSRAPSPAGNAAHGWVGYSYRTPDVRSEAQSWPADVGRAELTRALTEPSDYDPATPPVFAHAIPVPEMAWKARPARGHVRGMVRTSEGRAAGNVRIDLYDAGSGQSRGSQIADGSGWFGFVDLVPGRYRIAVEGGGAVDVTVSAGELTTLALRAPRVL